VPAAKDQEHAPGTQNAPAFLSGILFGDAGSRSDRCEAKPVFGKEPRLLPFGMAVGLVSGRQPKEKRQKI
jgi:hypothetical protein